MADQLPTSGGRVIENPVSGERIVIRASGEQTDGRLLSFDLYLPGGRHVPAGHVHPEQVERFTLLSGRLCFRMGGLKWRRMVLTQPGQTITIPAGTAHWFGNPGTAVAHARVDVEPALQMEALLVASEGLAASGSGWAPLARVIGLVLLLLQFEREIAVPHLPRRLVSIALGPIARLVRHP
jgi:quercetin dioxygenase-like cupin family protein